MYKYVDDKPKHRNEVGVGFGRQFFILFVDQKFVVDV